MVEGRVAATVAAVKGEEATVAATVVGRAVEGRAAGERAGAPEAVSGAGGVVGGGRGGVGWAEVVKVVEETEVEMVVVDSVACA